MFSFLQSIISKLATSAMSIFYLASIAEETGSSLALLETLKTDFVASTTKLSLNGTLVTYLQRLKWLWAELSSDQGCRAAMFMKFGKRLHEIQ